MTRAVGAVVIFLVLLGVLLGWWLVRGPRAPVAEESWQAAPAAGQEQTAPVSQPPPVQPVVQIPQPLQVEIVKLPDNINITVRKERPAGSTAAPAGTAKPTQKPRTSARRPPAATPPAVRAPAPTTHVSSCELREGEITPELLEQCYKRYLHNKTQAFLYRYPRQ